MAEVGIFVGTMYGNSLLVAEEAQAILSGLGHRAKVFEDPEVKDCALVRRHQRYVSAAFTLWHYRPGR